MTTTTEILRITKDQRVFLLTNTLSMFINHKNPAQEGIIEYLEPVYPLNVPEQYQ